MTDINKIKELLATSKSGAIISADDLFRYALWRSWDPSLPACTFVMLNPSTADATLNDPTISRCVSFARAFGCGSLLVVNLFAYRATKPEAMLKANDPVGINNETWIKEIVAAATGPVVCAWRARGGLRDQDLTVLRWRKEAGRSPQALSITKAGYPGHPLYLLSDSALRAYDVGRAALVA